LIKRSSKLGRESAYTLGVVGNDSKKESSISVSLGNLDEFVRVIKGHHVYIGRLGILNVRLHLARVGVDDSGRSNSTSKDLLNLGT
jgi:hypothetical protein